MNKVLFLFGSRHADYLEDMLCAGLVALLGDERVDRYPHKAHFKPVRPAQYPERSCWSHHLVWPSLDDVDVDYREYDLVVLGHPHDAETAAWMQDVVVDARSAGAEVALVNGRDRVDWLVMDEVHSEGPWFVREHHDVPSLFASRTVPTPLCYNTADLPLSVPSRDERDIDIVWVGALHYGRTAHVDALRAWGAADKSRRVVIHTDPIPRDEYLALLLRSKCALVLPGAGLDTYRRLEVAAHGCVALMPGDDFDAATAQRSPQSRADFLARDSMHARAAELVAVALDWD